MTQKLKLFGHKLILGIIHFFEMTLAGIDDLAGKHNTVLRRGPVSNLKRSIEINRKIIKGEHTSDDLVEQSIIREINGF
ncbi:hypothetical protein [Paenibacillus ihuae]|uniref:hypothetical protein n=1 Tax=Paenibacillus ihuae TaxID=1232431 RepID=UPI0006D53CB6|nr:hypothetical protein [Paenibacillus ihuae]